MPDRLPAERYERSRLLAQGAEGDVYSAVDRRTAERVAAKCLHQPIPTEARPTWEKLRRSLLHRPQPGVVDLLDLQLDGERPYVVMRLVQGERWPGAHFTPTWLSLQRPFRRLLSSLMSLHRLEVAHGDVKPDNALVGRDGEVVLVDLGAATLGTPGYRAPELAASAPATPAADLYAAAAMLWECLTGELDQRTRLPIDSAPETVHRLLVRMLDHDPDRRPRSAEAVLAELNQAAWDSATVRALLPVAPQSAVDLQPLFVGHELVWHGPSDAAEALWQLTGGAPERVLDELRAWSAADHVTWHEALQRFEVPPTLDLRRRVRHLLPPRDAAPRIDPYEHLLVDLLHLTWPHGTVDLLATVAARELRALPGLLRRGAVTELADGTLRPRWRYDATVADRAPYHELAAKLPNDAPARLAVLLAINDAHAGDEALRRAAALRAEGETVPALEAPLHALLAGIRFDPHTIEQLVRAVALAALSDGRSEMLARALRACEQHGADTRRGPLLTLVARCLELHGGRAPRTRCQQIAWELHRLPPFDDDELELHRHAARVAAVMSLGPDERRPVRQELEQWARRCRSPALQERARYALQVLAVAEGTTLEGGPAEHDAYDPRRAARRQLAAAAAALNEHALDRAEQHAQAAIASTLRVRQPEIEAQALTVLRMVAYRRQRDLGPDEALLAAVRPLASRDVRLPVVITEVAFSWRAGDLTRAAAIAHEAVAELGADHLAGALMLSLAQWCAPAADFDAEAAIATTADGRAAPAVQMQAFALLCAAGVPAYLQLHDRLAEVQQHAPPSTWRDRREVLSAAECQWIAAQQRAIDPLEPLGALDPA